MILTCDKVQERLIFNTAESLYPLSYPNYHLCSGPSTTHGILLFLFLLPLKKIYQKVRFVFMLFTLIRFFSWDDVYTGFIKRNLSLNFGSLMKESTWEWIYKALIWDLSVKEKKNKRFPSNDNLVTSDIQISFSPCKRGKEISELIITF